MTDPTPIRVVLADDDALIRAGLSTIVGADPAIEVVAEAGDGREAVTLVGLYRPDIVLMDIRMPRLNGLEAIAELRSLRTSVRIIVLTTFADDEYLGRALELGVDGYLVKSSAPADITGGIRSVSAGGAALSPMVARWIMTHGGRGIAAHRIAAHRAKSLTDRQLDVLRRMAQGDSNAEIGRHLYLSEATVKGYVSDILIRLGVAGRVQAAVIAHEAGLLYPQTAEVDRDRVRNWSRYGQTP